MAIALQKKKTGLQSIETEKNELAVKLLSLKDVAIVQAFKVIFEDLTAKTDRITKAQYNKEIDTAVKRVRSGKSVSNEDVMNEMDKW